MQNVVSQCVCLLAKASITLSPPLCVCIYCVTGSIARDIQNLTCDHSPALLQVEDIAAEVAKQAKPQADKAAQIVRGTAQGIKEQAEPTAKVHCSLH